MRGCIIILVLLSSCRISTTPRSIVIEKKCKYKFTKSTCVDGKCDTVEIESDDCKAIEAD